MKAMKSRQEHHLPWQGVERGRPTTQKTSAKAQFAAFVEILRGTPGLRVTLVRQGVEEGISRKHEMSAANFLRTRPLESMPSKPLAAVFPTSNQ